MRLHRPTTKLPSLQYGAAHTPATPAWRRHGWRGRREKNRLDAIKNGRKIVREHVSLDQIDSDQLSCGDSASSARVAQGRTTSINLVSTPVAASARIGADMVSLMLQPHVMVAAQAGLLCTGARPSYTEYVGLSGTPTGPARAAWMILYIRLIFSIKFQ
jgi:hypothetical protein